jgi:hypothetical protein
MSLGTPPTTRVYYAFASSLRSILIRHKAGAQNPVNAALWHSYVMSCHALTCLHYRAHAMHTIPHFTQQPEQHGAFIIIADIYIHECILECYIDGRHTSIATNVFITGERRLHPPSPSGLPLLNAIAQIVVGDEIQACVGHETPVRQTTRWHHSLESSAPDFGLVFFPEANHLSILERSYL